MVARCVSVSHSVAGSPGNGLTGHDDVLSAVFGGFHKLIYGIAADFFLPGVKGVEQGLRSRRHIGGARGVESGLFAGLFQGGLHPAHEAPAFHGFCSSGQNNRIPHIGGGKANLFPVGQVCNGGGRLGGKVDLHRAVGGRIYQEHIAVLRNVGRAAGDGKTGGVIAGFGESGNVVAIHGNGAIIAVIGGSGDGVGLAKESPGRVGSQHTIHVALTGISVLGGSHHRESNLIVSGLGFRVGGIHRVPLTLQVHLRLLNGGACLHTVFDIAHNGLDALQLALEGDGLRITVDDFNALGPQRREHPIRCHA